MDIALTSRRIQSGALAWGLPKGRVDPEEDLRQTALREVLEEAGLECEIEHDLGSISYWYVWGGERIFKVVHFFLMRVTGGNISNHDREMEDVRWFPAADVLRAASYASEREVLERALEYLQ